MLMPVLTAYLELIRFGFHIRRKNFAALHCVTAACTSTRLAVPLWRNCVGRSILLASGMGKRCFACNAPRPRLVCFDAMEYPHNW